MEATLRVNDGNNDKKADSRDNSSNRNYHGVAEGANWLLLFSCFKYYRSKDDHCLQLSKIGEVASHSCSYSSACMAAAGLAERRTDTRIRFSWLRFSSKTLPWSTICLIRGFRFCAYTAHLQKPSYRNRRGSWTAGM